MSQEKMMILKMLQEGKITADEASKLLDSVSTEAPAASTAYNSKNDIPSHTPPPVAPPSPTPVASLTPPVAPSHSSAPAASTPPYQEPIREPRGQEFGRKVESLARELEPKLRKFTEVAVEKTAMFADKLSKTLSMPPSPDERPKAAAPVGKDLGYELQCELTVIASEMNELNISCTNGYVFIKGYNGDKISAKIYYTPAVSGSEIQLMRLGSTYYINYDKDKFKSVNIEAYVPSQMFKKIQLETTNADITLEGITTNDLFAYNQNGKIGLKNLKTATVKAETNNAQIAASNLVGYSAVFEAYNGGFDGNSLDFENLDIECANAPVTMLIPSFSNFSNYNWKIRTSNERLKINLPSAMEIGYDIKAYTSLSEVAMGMSSLIYKHNSKNSIEAVSENFSSAYKKVKLEMDTSNAMLSINM